MDRTTGTEFRFFIELLRIIGIKFDINWGPTKEEWQRHIFDSGFSVTALSCTVVSTADTDFLFANGQAHWTARPERGYGPYGALLLSRSKATGKVAKRGYFDSKEEKFLGSILGLEAVKHSYPGDWPVEDVREPAKA